MINPSFTVTKEEIESFTKNGFVKLKHLFTKKATDYLRTESKNDLKAPKLNYKKFTSRHDYENKSNSALNLLQSSSFKKALAQLSQRSIFLTQGMSFEIEKNVNPGFSWHSGTSIFGYQRREDFACTLWIPLTKIDRKSQGGGMNWVSKKAFHGGFYHQLFEYFLSYAKELQTKEIELSNDELLRFTQFISNSPIKDMLEYYAESDDFEVGDAFLFDKEVFHRSNPLTEGPLDTRVALVMRFVEASSKFDMEKVRNFDPLVQKFDYFEAVSTFDAACNSHGQTIIDSPMFDSTREMRLVSFGR